ncbi:MAG: Ig-like domain-containing protein [Saprospiraceae bacterium]
MPVAHRPDHGTVNWVSNGSYQYTLTYTPDAGFIGVDEFRIIRWEISPAPHFVYLDVQVVVAPALIVAYHDYAVTAENQSITIDVLANDISSNGVKVLQDVPAINHGTATFEPTTGLITFTPTPGFKGLAHFNYALCNGVGDCDDGTVSITVMSSTVSTEDEVIKVFTKMEKPQFILVPPEYTLIQFPNKGFFDGNQDVPVYIPNSGQTGADEIRFTDGNHQLIFDIEILPLADNSFAFDDRAFTTTNTPIEIAVKQNDFSTGSCGLGFYTLPENGTVQWQGTRVLYTPNPGFVGVDQFVYESYISSCAGDPEYATVTVFVSNFAPDRTVFEMATPRNTPMIIGYNVPAATFRFEVTSPGDLGNTLFLEGVVDTVINGVPVLGNNILIYIPHSDVEAGLDEIEIDYCLEDITPGSTACLVNKQVKIFMTILNVGDGDTPVCVGDCVWAGDTNADGIVNMNDLLPIGRSMGEIGSERPDATMDVWYGQYADDWSDLFTTGETVNVKHIDADGNSIITALDTVAIRSFYGRMHNMLPNVMAYAPYEFILEAFVCTIMVTMLSLQLN